MNISEIRAGEPLHGIGKGLETSRKAVLSPNYREAEDKVIERLLAESGVKLPPEIRQLLGDMLKQGDAMTRELIQNLSQILQQAEGSMAQKINVLHMLIQKQIPITAKSFDAVYQAIHGPNIDQLLKKVLPEVDPNAQLASKGDASVQKLLHSLTAIVSSLKDLSHIDRPLITSIIPTVKEGLENRSWNPNLEKMAQELVQAMDRAEDRLEHAGEVNAKLNELNLADLGSRSLILSVKDKAQQLLTALQQEANMMPQVDVLSAHFTRIWEHIPQHLRQVGEEFREIKQQVIKNVERMSLFIQNKFPQAESYVQRVIEPTIEMINKLVQKNEFALFADMEFESDVLKLSGELQRVKGLLDEGNQAEALKTFQKIKSDLEKLHWQPSYIKMEQAITKFTQEGSMRNPLASYIQDFQSETLTGRGVQEAIRHMGLNHERDTVDFLIRKEAGEFSLSQAEAVLELEQEPRNIKSMLFQQAELDSSPRVRQAADQALSHLTGQQLLSKPEQGSNSQTFFLQLPVPWEQGMQSVKLEIHSRSKGEKVDWENCQLFFYLDTPRFGKTGISVRVTNREVTLKIQNDQSGIEEAFSPYIPQMRDKLKELGYRIQDVQFAPVNKGAHQEGLSKRESQALPKYPPYSSQKGLDFTV
ncbi:hypothetical protein [Ammoniphilus sp. 3BR4]|uniref:hypothetical protein n=1 Tax=Ammoniphilus sp. 3BR4 TaxID=3158265 RepID=UPI003464EEEC